MTTANLCTHWPIQLINVRRKKLWEKGVFDRRQKNELTKHANDWFKKWFKFVGGKIGL